MHVVYSNTVCSTCIQKVYSKTNHVDSIGIDTITVSDVQLGFQYIHFSIIIKSYSVFNTFIWQLFNLCNLVGVPFDLNVHKYDLI